MENKDENKLVPKKMKSHMPTVKEYTHEQMLQMAEIYWKSNLAPEHLKSKEAIFIAMMWARALSLDIFLGLGDIFVIDNIPSLRTEAALGKFEVSGEMEYHEQYFEGTPYEDGFTAVFKIKMHGRKEHISTFSVADAKRAGLWEKRTKLGKPTAWITYPKRMLMYRAVGFGLRDQGPHLLRGARLREEVQDYSEYTVVDDNSTADKIEVRVEKKPEYKKGMNKMMGGFEDAEAE